MAESATTPASAPAGAPAAPAAPAAPVPEQPATAPGRPIRAYDFRRPRHLSAEQMKGIHRVHAAAADAVQARLARYLGVSLDVRLESTEEIACGLFMDTLPPHTYANILDLSPLHERGLFLIDSPLCLAFVDRVLGGQCRTAPKARPLTSVDQAGAESSIEHVLRCLREAWKDLYPMKLSVLDRRTSADQATVAPRGEPLLAVTFLIKGELGEGRVRLCMPVAGLKAALGGAQKAAATVKPAADKATVLRASLMHSLEKASLPLLAVVGTADVPLGHLTRLKPGDVLRLDQRAEAAVLLKVGGRAAFWGRMGLRGRRKAVQIIDRVDQTEEE